MQPYLIQVATLPKSHPQPHPPPHWCTMEMASCLQELLCSFLRCLLLPAVVLGLMGPLGRVLALAQGKVGFIVGEEKGVEDTAGETRAQPHEPQQGPSHLHRGRRGEPHTHTDRQACMPSRLHLSPLLCDLIQVSPRPRPLSLTDKDFHRPLGTG